MKALNNERQSMSNLTIESIIVEGQYFTVNLSNDTQVYGEARKIGGMLSDAGLYSLHEDMLTGHGLTMNQAEDIMAYW